MKDVFLVRRECTRYLFWGFFAMVFMLDDHLDLSSQCGCEGTVQMGRELEGLGILTAFLDLSLLLVVTDARGRSLVWVLGRAGMLRILFLLHCRGRMSELTTGP
jgi:hypothetical protein